MNDTFRKLFFKKWYKMIHGFDKNGDVTFMNYGYHSEPKLELNADDEKNRYTIQLYDYVCSHVPFKNRSVLEIGCGKGGGLDYIVRTKEINEAVGLDLSPEAVDFANKRFKDDKISFITGDATSLPFKNETFDIIINIESSHRYPDFKRFLNCCYDNIKPNGYLLFADFRKQHKVDQLQQLINNSDFKILFQENITSDVISALINDEHNRRQLVKKIIPPFLQKAALNFAGVPNTKTFNMFKVGKLQYLCYVLQKI